MAGTVKPEQVGHGTRRALLAVWFIVLIPGGIGDLLFNPHRVATSIALVTLGAIVLATSRRWPRALGPVSVVLAIVLIADDLFDSRGVWGTISLVADIALALTAIADLWLGGGRGLRSGAVLPQR
jgi:hypothetical protein